MVDKYKLSDDANEKLWKALKEHVNVKGRNIAYKIRQKFKKMSRTDKDANSEEE